MTPERYERVGRLFAATCDLGPQECADLLDRECADDASLRSDVDWLLANDADPSSFMENPALGDDFHLGRGPTPDEPDGSLVGQRISQYRLTRVIAAGGMGTVYEAEQDKPERTVAVKVMRRGITSRSALRRFEYEAQILARLRHPGIAQVFEAGSSGDGPERSGVPYFVMEYIANAQPITEYAKTQGLTTRRRLELFTRVCDAVQHGHQRGIIHRDLKPGNILVDSSGEPKIIDFGVARATDSDMAVTTMQTDVGQLLGTLQYMSPEQCAANPHDLDTRTDVYSLGVVLYELLCEQLPYDVTHAGVPEAVRVVREEVPPRPSSINYALRGDVETIVLKALEKEPSRRYQSASAFAEDVGRYLANEPILARAPSSMYQFKKLVSRHKLPFGLILTLLLVMIGFTIGLTILYGRAIQAEGQSEERRLQAELEAETATAVKEFLIDDLLTSAKPQIALGRDVTVEEVLRRASKRIGPAFEHQPLIKASIFTTLGDAYLSLGLGQEAETHFRTAADLLAAELGDDHPQTLSVNCSLVLTLWRVAKLPEAAALGEKTFHTCVRALGEHHEVTLMAAYRRALSLWFQGRFDEATVLSKQTLDSRRRILGEDHPDTLASVNQWIGLGLRRDGDTSEAERLLRNGLDQAHRAFGEFHPETFRAMVNLGSILRDQRRFEEAEPLLREAYEGLRKILGENHPSLLSTMNELALLMREQDRIDESMQLTLQAVELGRRTMGEENPELHQTLYSLATDYLRDSNYGEAAAVFRELLILRRRIFGDDHHLTAQTLDGLSFALCKLGKYVEAEEGHRKALDVHRLAQRDGIAGARVSVVPINTMWCLRNLIRALAAQGKQEEARLFSEELLELRRLGAEKPEADAWWVNSYARELLTVEPVELRHPERALRFALLASERSTDSYHYNRYTLALAYEANGDIERAIESVERALDAAPLEASSERDEYEAALVRFHEKSDDPQAAEDVYRAILASRRGAFPADHLDIASSLERLGSVLLRHGKSDKAEQAFRECLAIRRRLLPKGHWRTAHAETLLGVSLAGVGRFVEAELLLIGGYNQMAGDERAPRQRIHDAVRQIIELYETWEIPEKATEWHAKLSHTDPDSPSR